MNTTGIRKIWSLGSGLGNMSPVKEQERKTETQRERESLGRNYVQFNLEGQKIKMKVWKGKLGSFYI